MGNMRHCIVRRGPLNAVALDMYPVVLRDIRRGMVGGVVVFVISSQVMCG
jgi:hypothetical protein